MTTTERKIEISPTTGLMLGNGLSMCADSLRTVLVELVDGDISFDGMARLRNAIEFIGGVGGDFSKHAKGMGA